MERDTAIIEILKEIETLNKMAKEYNIDVNFELKGINSGTLHLNRDGFYLLTSANAGGDYEKFVEWGKDMMVEHMKFLYTKDFYSNYSKIFGYGDCHPIKEIHEQTIKDWGLDENYHTPVEDDLYYYYDD